LLKVRRRRENVPVHSHLLFAIGTLAVFAVLATAMSAEDALPFLVSDYDSGNVYWVRDGGKQPCHGMRESWVFNRAMTWLDDQPPAGTPPLCYATQSPLLLTGRKQVSRWYAGPSSEVADVGDESTRYTARGGKSTDDHVSLPPLQFPVEQTPTAALDVTEPTHPWQFVVAVKGRSGPPLYCSPWRAGPGRLDLDILGLYRAKGYEGHYAELQFAIFVKTKEPGESATLTFSLRLNGRKSLVPSLPVIRTAARAEKDGVPLRAVVLSANAERLGNDAVAVTATVGGKTIPLADEGNGVWRAAAQGLPAGEHKAVLTDRKSVV
jgi:hypothetical protein